MRLIDADALIEAHYQYCNEHHGEMDVFLTWSHKLIKDAPTIEPKQADDLISRTDAINAIAKYLKEDYALNGQEPNERHARWGASVILENVPSAQPKRGEWITTLSGHWKCSRCNCRAGFWFEEENSCEWDMDMSEWLSDFCPNCGADMRQTERSSNA